MSNRFIPNFPFKSFLIILVVIIAVILVVKLFKNKDPGKSFYPEPITLPQLSKHQSPHKQDQKIIPTKLPNQNTKNQNTETEVINEPKNSFMINQLNECLGEWGYDVKNDETNENLVLHDPYGDLVMKFAWKDGKLISKEDIRFNIENCPYSMEDFINTFCQRRPDRLLHKDNAQLRDAFSFILLYFVSSCPHYDKEIERFILCLKNQIGFGYEIVRDRKYIKIIKEAFDDQDYASVDVSFEIKISQSNTLQFELAEYQKDYWKTGRTVYEWNGMSPCNIIDGDTIKELLQDEITYFMENKIPRYIMKLYDDFVQKLLQVDSGIRITLNESKDSAYPVLYTIFYKNFEVGTIQLMDQYMLIIINNKATKGNYQSAHQPGSSNFSKLISVVSDLIEALDKSEKEKGEIL